MTPSDTDSPTTGSPLRTLVGTAALARRAVATGRGAASHIGDGETGNWDAELSIDGLSDERREQLVEALCRVTGHEPGEPVGDGKLRVRGQVDNVNLQVAAACALSNFGVLLHKAELRSGELRASVLEFSLAPGEPEPEPQPKGVRAAIGRRLGIGRLVHGIDNAAADAFDVAAQQEHGPGEYVVLGVISELDEAAVAKVAKCLADHGSPPELVDQIADAVPFEVLVKGIGTPLGAMALFVRRMANVLVSASSGSTLRLFSAADED